MRLPVLAVAALASLSAEVANAQSADTSNSRAFCAVVSERGSTPRCSHDTFQQCRDTISGVGGLCIPNSFYQPPAGTRRVARR